MKVAAWVCMVIIFLLVALAFGLGVASVWAESQELADKLANTAGLSGLLTFILAFPSIPVVVIGLSGD